MPDSCDQLRAQIRALQGERRSLESKLMQPQGMLAASLVERFLRAGGTPRAAPAYYLSRSEHGRSTLTYVKKEEAGCGAAALRRLPRLPAESEAVAAGHRSPATAVGSSCSRPNLDKTFFSVLCRFRWTFDGPCVTNRRDDGFGTQACDSSGRR